MLVKLVGYKNFKSKAGKDMTIAIVESEFTPYDQSHGSVGVDARQVFLPDDQVGTLTEKDIGKNVDLVYEINFGRAYLRSFVVK